MKQPKIVGCGGTALACRESFPVSLRVGAGMVSRGEIALVVASVGLSQGVVTSGVFSIAIVVTVATTVAAPLLLKAVYQITPARHQVSEDALALASEPVPGQ